MEKRIVPLNELEKHGVSALIGQRRQIVAQIEELTRSLGQVDAAAARALAGKVDGGRALSDLIQDPGTGEVFFLVPRAVAPMDGAALPPPAPPAPPARPETPTPMPMVHP